MVAHQHDLVLRVQVFFLLSNALNVLPSRLGVAMPSRLSLLKQVQAKFDMNEH
jgi:hypothetical protein